jgi:F-type H+-transporting ATPase subunit g
MSPENILSSVRNMKGSQVGTAAIIFAQVLGFFTVGEMIGRMKLVGYHGEVHHAHGEEH